MKLTHLTDLNLLSTMVSLVNRERALLAEVLWHLKEIDRRKLYCETKCGSLFEYCVKVLKYSEAQASRRVTACRVLKEMPEIVDDIKKGEINLTQLNQAKNFFNDLGITEPTEKRLIIEEIKGKTVEETETILAGKRDESTPRKVTISLKEETVNALYKIKGLKAHTFSDLDSLIMGMIKVCTKEWDPSVVYRQRKIGAGDTRYVQEAVKARVWERDKGQCTNCGSCYALEYDHIKPFALGGKTVVENLRLLCRNCNQRKGFEVFNYLAKHHSAQTNPG